MTKAFEYRHVVSFEETNLVGNVYFVNFLRWQGRCRELFLMQYAREVCDQFEQGLALMTTRCACEFKEELSAFDEVLIAMRLDPQTQKELSLGSNQSRIALRFDYFRMDRDPSGEERRRVLVATGSQEIACMWRRGSTFVSTPFPESLLEALSEYS